jgi:hypothetical protein
MTSLDIGSMVLDLPRRGPPNPLPPLRLLGELHGEVDRGGLDAEMARNLAYGRVDSVLPYLLEDDYSRELVARETAVAVLENEHLRAVVLLALGGRLWSLRDKTDRRELLFSGDQVRFGNLGLRNAWFAGGVEWNLGTTGHTALTCSPLHAAALELPGGTPGLRVYEWERMRELVYQLDFRLGPGARHLAVDVTVTNPNPRAVPVYWWSNIAVAGAAGTRVVVPSRSAFAFTYAGRLDRVPVPGPGADDLTYPQAAARTVDHFFELEPTSVPWIAAVGADGTGLLQASSRRLRGRKLFTWGTGRGGRRWQEFLCGPGASYFEVQAGLATTQLEHLPLGPGAAWSWSEVYGPVALPAAAVHAAWAGAVAAVESAVAEGPIRALLDRPPGPGVPSGARLHRGSGWGALESLRRAAAGEPPSPVLDRLFPRSGLGDEQAPWIELLETGALPPGPPRSYAVGPGWSPPIEAAADSAAAMLHRGVARWHAGRRAAAVAAWEAAAALDPGSWLALRNLAAAHGLMGEPARSAERYLDALELRPDLAQLRVEAVQALLAAGRHGEAAERSRAAPGGPFAGRLRLLRAVAAARGGDPGRARSLLDAGLEVADLREGETSLSDLWLACQEPAAAGPLPEVPPELDFRLDG